jgi:hypothetical protein
MTAKRDSTSEPKAAKRPKVKNELKDLEAAKGAEDTKGGRPQHLAFKPGRFST